MPATGDVVVHLAKKVLILAEAVFLTERQDWGAYSLDLLCDHLGIPTTTLESAIREGRVTPKLQAKLSRDGQLFELIEPSWIDRSTLEEIRENGHLPNYEGVDTAAYFRRMVWKKWSLTNRSILKILGHDPHHLDKDLAGFNLSGGQGATDLQTLPVDLEVYARIRVEGIVRYGLRRLRIRVEFQNADKEGNSVRVPEMVSRLGSNEPFPLRDDTTLAHIGIRSNPEWMLDSSGPAINRVYNVQEHLFEISDAAAGDLLMAKLAVNLRDDAYLYFDGPPKEVGTNKRRIIEVLLGKRLPGERDGAEWKTLATQVMSVVRP